MMGLDDIMISFAVSVGAGIVNNLIEDIRSNKDLDARMNKCFNNALNKWEVSQETRNILHSESLKYLITAKPKAHAFKNEMCFPLTKTKCELKKHPNSKFECFFNDFNRTRTSLFLPFPSKLIQDNLVCVLELQE